ncbi:MAG: hypothetical protein MUP28_03400 [Candidatus Aminicenantes bacterium]|nr:hypothetical protein [Candidatus Aminicenantes bacterium]
MSDIYHRLILPAGRSIVPGRILHAALLAVFLSAMGVVPALADDPIDIDFPSEPLISVWEHSDKVDIAPMIKEVGFNTVWTHDKPYDGKMKLEDTLMYRHMKTPGVKYIIAKIERGIWGWKFDEAMRHAAWIAELSLTHKEIIGLYLNDFYEETEETAKGGHSADEFRQIIAQAKGINPRLAIWAPCYPPGDLDKPYDFDIDAIIFSFYDTTQLQNHEQLLDQVLKKFPGKPILGSLYLDAGSEHRWLTEQEFKGLMDFFVEKVNEGRLAGIRVFRVESLIQRPEYVIWLKESLSKLKRP